MSHVHTFYLVDLDRTLFNTSLQIDQTIELVRRDDERLADELATAMKDMTFFGATYTTYDFLVERLGKARAVELDAQFLQSSGHIDYWLPGATEILKYIHRKGANTSGGILTYGIEPRQRLKVQALGLYDYPVYVTDDRRKGLLIASWWRDGRFRLPKEYGAVTADEIVFIDDHPGSFEGLPDHVRGYWVSDYAIESAESEGLRPGVIQAKSLYDVVASEEVRRLG